MTTIAQFSFHVASRRFFEVLYAEMTTEMSEVRPLARYVTLHSPPTKPIMLRGRLVCVRSSVNRTCPLLVDNNGGVPGVDVEQCDEKGLSLPPCGVVVMNGLNWILSVACVLRLLLSFISAVFNNPFISRTPIHPLRFVIGLQMNGTGPLFRRSAMFRRSAVRV